MRRLIIASLALLLAGCTPPKGGWDNYNNYNPYALPEYHGGYTPQ
jgi:hypothetical protein